MNPSAYASIHTAINIHSYTSTGNYWMQRSHTVHAPTALPPSTPGTEKYAFLFPLAQFFKMLQLMGYEWANNLEHVNYGLVLGMSTRKGTVVFLDQIIREASSVMHEQMRKNEDKYSAIEDPETVATEIGIAGIKIQDMAAKRINNYNFNWDRMLSFEGDTGPYLQYAHVRLSSIERKNSELILLLALAQLKTELVVEPPAREIAFLLGSYPDVVKTALKPHEPSGIVTFASRDAISSVWETVIVRGKTDGAWCCASRRGTSWGRR